MRKYAKRTLTETYLTECRCDACGADIGPTADVIERQEALTISLTGGFGSVFGDGVTLSTDLCQRCLQKRLGDVLHEDTPDEDAATSEEGCMACRLIKADYLGNYDHLAHTCGKIRCEACESFTWEGDRDEKYSGYGCGLSALALPRSIEEPGSEAPDWCPKRKR